MASETYYTPQAPVRWCHLITAREQLERNKPRAWTVEMVLSKDNSKHCAFLDELDKLFVESHGSKKTRSEKGEPWKLDKTDPSKVVVKFKTLEFVRDDGSKSSPPQLIDSKRAPWDKSAVGNGSELIIKFSVYAWDRPEGVGITLQPKAAQVVAFVPREDEDATEGFDEVEGGYAVADAGGFVDEFANPDELGI